jgi:hypothetical protein
MAVRAKNRRWLAEVRRTLGLCLSRIQQTPQPSVLILLTSLFELSEPSFGRLLRQSILLSLDFHLTMSYGCFLRGSIFGMPEAEPSLTAVRP